MPDTSWIGSLDVAAFVKTQMDREIAGIEKSAAPFLQQLQDRKSELSIRSDVYQQIQELLNGFNTSLTKLKTAFAPTYQVGYSATGIASATISGTPTPGSHSLHVATLATAASLQSKNYSSTSTALGLDETLEVTIGSPSSPTQQFNVTIKPGDNLQSVVANINNTAKVNNAGVVASIVSTSDGNYQLVVSSTQTGLKNAVSINEPGDSMQLTTVTAAQDADFTIDNVFHFTGQASNTNLIQGMNITLLAQGDTNILVTSTNSVDQVKTAMQDMVTAYNKVMSLISQAQVQFSSPDPQLSLISSGIQDKMKGVFSDLIGIVPNTTAQSVTVALANGKGSTTVYLTGLLQIDDSMLSSALTNRFSQVESSLFDSTNGIFTKMQSDVLSPGLGSAWKALNDIPGGAIIVNTSELSKVTQNIDDENNEIADKKAALTFKYAALQVTLQQMQNMSNYLYQQIQVMNNLK